MFDPRQPTLKTSLATGKCLGVVWLSLGSVAIAELAARSRPDAVVIDMQHGLWERRDLEAAIGVVPSAIPVIVRVAENSALAIGTALDAGAEGVIVPLVETAKQARRAVSHAKYPPHGERSGGGVRPLQDFVNYVDAAGHIAVMVMVETAKGLANVDEIAAVDGVDMVFIGTGDLALSIGAFPKPSHDHAIACADIHRASRSAWVPCGVFTGGPDMARTRRDQGYRLVVIANDIDLVQGGFAGSVAKFRAPTAPPVALASKANGGGAKLIETDRIAPATATLPKLETAREITREPLQKRGTQA